MEIKEIKQIIDLMKKNDLSVFKLEHEGFKLTLKKGPEEIQMVTSPQAHAAAPPAAAPAAKGEAGEAAAEEKAAAGEKEISAPMVGTFYRAPSPDSKPFVEVGDKIQPDSVVCIIEAMKVMNEIKAETSGTISEVTAQDGTPVQFGEALFKVK